MNMARHEMVEDFLKANAGIADRIDAIPLVADLIPERYVSLFVTRRDIPDRGTFLILMVPGSDMHCEVRFGEADLLMGPDKFKEWILEPCMSNLDQAVARSG